MKINNVGTHPTILSIMCLTLCNLSAMQMELEYSPQKQGIFDAQQIAARAAWDKKDQGLTAPLITSIVDRALKSSSPFSHALQEVAGQAEDQEFLRELQQTPQEDYASGVSTYIITQLLIPFVDADAMGEKIIQKRIPTISKDQLWPRAIASIKAVKAAIEKDDQDKFSKAIGAIGSSSVRTRLTEKFDYKHMQKEIITKIEAALESIKTLGHTHPEHVEYRINFHKDEISQLLATLAKTPDSSAMQEKAQKALREHDLSLTKETEAIVSPIKQVFQAAAQKTFKEIAKTLNAINLEGTLQQLRLIKLQIVNPASIMPQITSIAAVLYVGFIVTELNKEIKPQQAQQMKTNIQNYLRNIPPDTEDFTQANRAITEHDQSIVKEITKKIAPIKAALEQDKNFREMGQLPVIAQTNFATYEQEISQQIEHIVNQQSLLAIRNAFIPILKLGGIIQQLSKGISKSIERDSINLWLQQTLPVQSINARALKATQDYDQELLATAQSAGYVSERQLFFDPDKEQLAEIMVAIASDKDTDVMMIPAHMKKITKPEIRRQAQALIDKHDANLLEKIGEAQRRQQNPEVLIKKIIDPQTQVVFDIDEIKKELEKGQAADLAKIQKLQRTLTDKKITIDQSIQEAINEAFRVHDQPLIASIEQELGKGPGIINIKTIKDSLGKIIDAAQRDQIKRKILTHDDIILGKIRIALGKPYRAELSPDIAKNKQARHEWLAKTNSALSALTSQIIDDVKKGEARRSCEQAERIAVKPVADAEGRFPTISDDLEQQWQKLQAAAKTDNWAGVERLGREIIAAYLNYYPQFRDQGDPYLALALPINLYDIDDPNKDTVWTTAANLWEKSILSMCLDDFLNQNAKNLALVKAAQNEARGDEQVAAQTASLELLLINGASIGEARKKADQLFPPQAAAIKQRMDKAFTPAIQLKQAINNTDEHNVVELLKNPELQQKVKATKDFVQDAENARHRHYFSGRFASSNFIYGRISDLYNAQFDTFKSLFDKYQAAAEPEKSMLKNKLITNFSALMANEECSICLRNFLAGPEESPRESTFKVWVFECGHCFHMTCANKIPSEGGEPPRRRCPLCRNLSKIEFPPIELQTDADKWDKAEEPVVEEKKEEKKQ